MKGSLNLSLETQFTESFLYALLTVLVLAVRGPSLHSTTYLSRQKQRV